MENLLIEIEILSRPYSSYRGGSKWLVNRESIPPPHHLITSDKLYVKIYRKPFNLLDYYPISGLIKRLEIKRNPSLFNCILKLWKLINPSALKAIPREVHELVLETLYKMHPQSLKIPDLAYKNLKFDSEIDFSKKLGLTFAEFYDAIFECCDSLTKSILVNEYCRVIQHCARIIIDSPSFVSMNLYNKRHLKEQQRPSFYPWMQTTIRSLTPVRTSEMQLPEILKKILHPNENISKTQRFLQKNANNEASSLERFSNFIGVKKKLKLPIRAVTPRLVNARDIEGRANSRLKGVKTPSLSPIKLLY